MVTNSSGATSKGFPNDSIWSDEWDRMWETRTRPRNSLRCTNELIQDCRSDFDFFASAFPSGTSVAELEMTFKTRWTAASCGSSPWRGIFQSTPQRANVFNFYNQDDAVFVVHPFEFGPWRDSQLNQKPWEADGALTPPFWARLNNIATENRNIWSSPDSDIVAKNALLSNWAKLAFWFQPLSGAAGNRPIADIFSAAPDLRQRNRPMATSGGSGGAATLYSSHTYPTSRAIWETLGLYQELKDVLTTGSRYPN